MIDHVTIRVSDLEASRAFYTCVLAPLGLEPYAAAPFTEWGDFSIAGDDKAVAQNIHIAFPAKSREEVDAFHRAAMEAGYRDNGSPGERSIYHEGYYGAFVLDPDGNNVEAVHHAIEPSETLDHLFVRVSGLEASRTFYERVLEPLGSGFWASGDEPDGEDWVALGSRGNSLWLVGGKPVTANLHLAFAAKGPAQVDAFHRAGVEAGYRSNGVPGLREYADDYYASYLLDPDSHNIEAVYRDPAKRAGWDWLRWKS